MDPRPWFRCPFGAGATTGGSRPRSRPLDTGTSDGMSAAEDWDPAHDGTVVENGSVEGALAHGDGTVILLHAWPRAMLAAMPGIVGRLGDAGARFVRVDELDEVPARPGWA